MNKSRPLEDTTDLDITEITDISLVCGLSEGLRFLSEKARLEEQEKQQRLQKRTDRCLQVV